MNKIIAFDKYTQRLYDQAKIAALSDSNIFICGESGTGKEVMAQWIHQNSLRREKPFITVNCAAVPESLMESEFFGHERGAFTGAISSRKGLFSQANRGSILLDEVAEIPLHLQPKFLRVIQEKEFSVIGGQNKKVDVRIISTANKNMQEAILKKSFREDLYFRLNVIPIYIKPLRERKGDILPFAEFFLKKFCNLNSKPLKTFTSAGKQKLLDYHWPGNIRELENAIERACVMEESDSLSLQDMETLQDTDLSLQELEITHILNTLKKYSQSKPKAAKALGISLKSLEVKLRAISLQGKGPL